ncbi:putative inorganic phosphate cotransporter [Copidosoma floridanum]|uniref:putative inorganic phosphate cotransporter n=1 Tax=Copidosoma floridanum TaxID=29053 RepID=UPI0006C9D611|nr:putative inorganic phosphate cotransporter [Copidosoma floridanum]
MPSAIEPCCAQIPQRWVFVFMGFLALFSAYAMRVCLSITVTQMVVPIHEKTTNFTDDTCPGLENDAPDRPTAFTGGTYEWSEYEQGVILSSFYWGYTLTQIPGGMIAERFGGKYTLGLGILVTGALTTLSPLAVHLGGSRALILLRLVSGLTCGVMFPAANVMLSHWIPVEERSMAGSLVFAGAPLGTVFASALSGLILERSSLGWPGVFYFFGGFGILWFLLFVILCYDSPDEHPFISDAEAKFLHDRLSQHKHREVPVVPWGRILRSKAVWALSAASIGNGWGFLTLVSDLNKYMSSVMKFSIRDNGYLSALPYLFMWLGSLITSWLSDWLVATNRATTTKVRKFGTTVASVGPAVFLIGASYAGCDRVAVVTAITAAMFLLGSSLPSVKVNVLDLTPNYAGSLMALTNCMASATGILTPYVVGLLTPNQTLAEWRVVFWIVAGVLLGTNVVFVLWASGEVQEWNNPEFLRKDKRGEGEVSKEELVLLPAPVVIKEAL